MEGRLKCGSGGAEGEHSGTGAVYSWGVLCSGQSKTAIHMTPPT